MDYFGSHPQSRGQLTERPIREKYEPKTAMKSPSQILFLNFLKYLGLIYLIVALCVFPIWVGIYQRKIVNNAVGREYVRENEGYQFSISEFFAMGTMINTKRGNFAFLSIDCYFDNQQENQGNFDNRVGCNLSFTLAGFDVGADEFRQFSLGYDLALQFFLILATMYLEWKSHNLKKKYKGNHIESYTIEIRNLPSVPQQILLPKIRRMIQTQVIKKYGLVIDKLEIFDAEVSLTEEETNYQIHLERKRQLLKRIKQQKSDGKYKSTAALEAKVKEIDLKIKQIEILQNHRIDKKTDRVWITVATREMRYYVLQTFKYNTESYWSLFGSDRIKDFMGKDIVVGKAPHPEEILWKNLYASNFKRYFFRILTLLVNIALLIGFDIIILLLQKHFPNPVLTVLLVFVLETVLKLLIQLLSSFELHNLKSRMDLSTMRKLTVFLYINTGLIIFISSYDLGDNSISNFISKRTYSEISESWYLQVGSILVIIVLLQCVYVSLRVYLDLIIKGAIKFILFYSSSFFQSLQRYRKYYQKQEVELDICYSYVLNLLMIGHTFSYSHPVFYTFMAVSMMAAYLTHSRFIQFYSQKAPYNNDKLDDNAIRFVFQGVLAHLFFVGVTERYIPSFVCFWVFLGIYIFRQFLLRYLLSIVRRITGPFISQGNQSQSDGNRENSLQGLLLQSQLNEKIKELRRRKDYLYQFMVRNRNSFSEENEKWLSKHEYMIDQAIESLSKQKPNKDKRIRGKIRYQIDFQKDQTSKKAPDLAKVIEEQVQNIIPTVDVLGNPISFQRSLNPL